MTSKSRIGRIALTCLWVFILTGCVETATMYRGNQVSSVPVMALEAGGPHAGRWQTFDLIIDYQYSVVDGVLDISGRVTPGAYYQMNFVTIVQMFVYAFFLDQDRQVLETVKLLVVVGADVSDIAPFSKRCQVPAGTTGVSFGYDGVAREMFDTSSFYELPLSKRKIP